MRRRIESAEFERVVREHHASTYRAALRVARDGAAALDATSEVFRRVLEGRLDIAAARDLGSLLRCAAAREALMHRRSERARSRREAEVAMDRHERVEDRGVESRELSGELAKALRELPDELRHAVALRFQEGLTFAEVGAALSISEPSAHQRVQRALERLRERLGRLGFAVALPELPEVLGKLEPLSVPQGLEARLLALKPSFVAAAAVPVALGAVLLAGAAALALTRGGGSEGGSARFVSADAALNAAAMIESGAERSEVPSAPAAGGASPDALSGAIEGPTGEQAQLAPATLEGRVLDALGLPVVGAEVVASSVQREGKFTVFGARARTSENGSFALELPVSQTSGEEYTLRVSTGTLHHTDAPVRALVGAELPYRTIRLPEEVSDRPGEWSLTVTVRDERGNPVPAARVFVMRPVRSEGATWLERESGASCDERGVVQLDGDRLGPKVLRVEARERGWAVFREKLLLDSEGSTAREVRLRPGAALVVRVLDELGQPAAERAVGEGWVRMYATESDANEWFEARVRDPEHAVVEALTSQPHTLHFRSDEYSSFTLRGVQPGGTPLEVQLKRKYDPTPGGTHGSEVHGAVFDAASGAPVALDFLEVNLERIEDDSPGLRDRDWWPLYSQYVSAQVMQTEDAGGPPRPPPHTFAMDGLEPGRYLVCFRVSGYAPGFAGPFELGRGEIAGPIEMRLERGTTVAGNVRAEDGRPTVGAWVLVVGPGELSRSALAAADAALRSSGGRGDLSVDATRCDARGEFVLPNLPAGRGLRAVALHPERSPGAAVELDPRPGARLELRLGPARPR